MCACVCVLVSEDNGISPYCSAHDEWLIMKLCMYCCMSGTILPTMCQIMVVTRLIFKKKFKKI